MVVVQWVELLPQNYRHQGLILSSGYCSLSLILPMSVWILHPLHFPPTYQNMLGAELVSLKGVNEDKNVCDAV